MSQSIVAPLSSHEPPNTDIMASSSINQHGSLNSSRADDFEQTCFMPTENFFRIYTSPTQDDLNMAKALSVSLAHSTTKRRTKKGQLEETNILPVLDARRNNRLAFEQLISNNNLLLSHTLIPPPNLSESSTIAESSTISSAHKFVNSTLITPTSSTKWHLSTIQAPLMAANVFESEILHHVKCRGAEAFVGSLILQSLLR